MRDEGNTNNIEKKKMLVLFVLIITLIVSTTGATYAFFALSATSVNTITGTSAKVAGTLSVSRIIPSSSSWNTSTKVMVPQLSVNNSVNTLKQAIDHDCVDGNNNVVCQVYRVIFRNAVDFESAVDPNAATVRINPKISTLTVTSGTGTMANLKWYVIKKPSSTTNTSSSSPGTNTVTYSYPTNLTNKYGNARTLSANLGDPLIVPSGNWGYWDVVVWIEETGNDQYASDGASTFVGSVDTQVVDSSGNVIGGLTSTFTG